MVHMKSASVRDLRQNFPRILAWLQSGEKVAITRRRAPIATLIPHTPRKRSRRPAPDVAARLRKVFGKLVIPDQAMQALLDQERGVY